MGKQARLKKLTHIIRAQLNDELLNRGVTNLTDEQKESLINKARKDAIKSMPKKGS